MRTRTPRKRSAKSCRNSLKTRARPCSYDPRTTAWTIRLDVWTPTAVADQAVGEPFQAFRVDRQSRDNGTGSMTGGGGIVILACLNAGTYVADGVVRQSPAPRIDPGRRGRNDARRYGVD